MYCVRTHDIDLVAVMWTSPAFNGLSIRSGSNWLISKMETGIWDELSWDQLVDWATLSLPTEEGVSGSWTDALRQTGKITTR